MAYSIALLPGDGIGPEVTQQATRVLNHVAELFGTHLSFSEHLIGGAALSAGLPPLPPQTIEAVNEADAVLLGAVGDPAFDHLAPGARPESGLLAIRQQMGVFANLRPARIWTGLEHSSPLKPAVIHGTDLIVVRELLGGLYYGEPRRWDRATDRAINTLTYSRPEIERVARVAFTLAQKRSRRVVSVDKANVLETSQLWRAVVTDVGRSFPDVVLTHEYVDACAMKLATSPASFDVILTENLFGDILSDEAGAICGSLGLLPSASLGKGAGLYEPVHGSAPALAGKELANPSGAILSAAMMLRSSCRLNDEAEAIERAVAETFRAGFRTADLAAPGTNACSTTAFGTAVVERLHA